jgi:hypothetical protein
MVAMPWSMVMVGVGLALLAPWIGIIILVVINGHLAERTGVLERELRVLKENMKILTDDLGWKTE